MASRIVSRYRMLNQALYRSQLCSISSFSGSSISSRSSHNSLSHFVLRSLFAASIHLNAPVALQSYRFLSTSRETTSSLKDPNPNWSNRPPKETILLDGCDFEHWLVVVEKPEGDPTREEIIDSYIKTLAMVVGSEDEARMKIYSVSTRCYFAFGALVSEELSYKIKELPKVRWVLPDSYLDVRNKDYGGEPFVNGEAVPYHPKYHEEWIRNHNQAMERNRRKDRQRNFDRSRNFERRRDNMPGYDSEFPIPRSTSGPPPPPPPPNYAPGPGAPPYGGGPGMQPNMRAPPPPPPYNTGGGMSSGPPQNNPGGFQQQFNRGMPPPPQPSQYGPPGGQRPNEYGAGGPNPAAYGAAPRAGQWPNTEQGTGPGQWQPQYGAGEGGMWRGHGGGPQPTGQPTGQPMGQPTGQPTVQPTVQPTGQPTGQPMGQHMGQPMGQHMGAPGWGNRGPGRDGFAPQNGDGEGIENNRGEASG